MGRKVHPYGFRVGITRDWQSRWFSERDYSEMLHEDLRLRRLIERTLGDAGISQVLMERNANQITMTVKTAKPGIVIGRGGQNAERLRQLLQSSTERRIRLNIEEVRVPEMDAQLTKLARETGRTKSSYVKQAIENFLEDRADYLLAVNALERDEGTTSAADLRRELGL